MKTQMNTKMKVSQRLRNKGMIVKMNKEKERKKNKVMMKMKKMMM